MMTSLRAALAVAALTFGVSGAAQAAAIFDLSPTNGTTYRDADFGPGQGIAVSNNITVTDFAFYANMPNGGDAKFMIWDGTNSSLLFSQTVSSIAASNTQSWIDSGPMSFSLTGGNRYYFGLIADSAIDIGFVFPPITYSSNGLTALQNGNSNYANFAAPTAYQDLASAEIGLQISAVPLPGAASMFGAALLGLGLLGVKSRKRVL